MLKILLALLLLISSATAHDYGGKVLSTQDINSCYHDYIIWINSESCIETDFNPMLIINNTRLNLSEFDSYDNILIYVHEIRRFDNRTVLADIYFEEEHERLFEKSEEDEYDY